MHGAAALGLSWDTPRPLPQVFFCKYNDPAYVKMEKLDIMMKLVNEKNIDQVRDPLSGCLLLPLRRPAAPPSTPRLQPAAWLLVASVACHWAQR